MLCCGTVFNKPERALGVVGVVVSALSMIWSLWLVWFETGTPTYALEILLTGIILTAACTFTSLLLAATTYRDDLIRILLNATLVFVAITTALLLLMVWNTAATNSDFFPRALGIALILAVVIGIVTPIFGILRRKADRRGAPIRADDHAIDPYRLDTRLQPPWKLRPANKGSASYNP